MKDRNFYDTSVLAYAFDSSELEKKAVAEKIIERVAEGTEIGAISNQILAELFFVLTRKFERPVPVRIAANIVNAFSASERWLKLNYTDNTVVRAAALCAEPGMRFWDVLIAETMKENGIATIITENVRDFKRIQGIRPINPFA